MCGRITQISSPFIYAQQIGWDTERWSRHPIANYNCSPGTKPWVMYEAGDHHGMMNLYWGYRPRWASEKGLPMSINARLEKATTGAYFRHLWTAGRIIVPAEGWYEWTGEKGSKQPWYIKLKTQRPMFMAALAHFNEDKKEDEEKGFALLTAAVEGGMIDIHDRRPIVLGAEDALLWMDHSFSSQQAEQLVRSMTLPDEAFEWHEVSKEVNRTTHNSFDLIHPLGVEHH